MKKLWVKVIFISMIIMMIGGLVPKERYANTYADEFAELENVYESKAPNADVAELSSTFTSSNEIEVYIKANPEEIEKVIISGWSGGAYQKYLTTKEATYDNERGIYVVTFQLNKIVNTTTNEVEEGNEIIYSFDAMLYGKNNTMSYVKLEDVQYADNGFITNTTTNENNENVLNITAEEDGYIAIVNKDEEVTDETKWQAVTAGINTFTLPKEESDTTNQFKVLYKAGEEITTNEISLLSEEPSDGISSYQNDATFNFSINEVSGMPSWISYDDTPNVFESTIQGKANTVATAIITIFTKYEGTLSFDYMVSSESGYDEFEVVNEKGERLLGATGPINSWKSFSKKYDAPESGRIIIKLQYYKDKNINRYEDKAAIRNLKFTSILPTNGEVIINGGNEFTASKDLNLKLTIDGGNYMHISETPEKPLATAEGWQTFENEITYTLKDNTDGEKKIYVWFKNSSGAMTLRAAIDSIKLDTVPPTNIAPTVQSTSNSIKVDLNQTDANKLLSIKYGYRIDGTADEYTWVESQSGDECLITGLTPMQDYEVVTKESDGANAEVTSESVIIKTKIPSDNIVITKSPNVQTLDDVTVTIKWNNDEYQKEYSLDNSNWLVADSETIIEMTQNGTIYYKMSEGTYETGILEYIVDNIDREGPKIKEIGVVTPTLSGKYGIDDEITIGLNWDEEVIVTSLPVLNIKFGDGTIIPLTAKKHTETTVTYEYVITGQDAGYLVIDSLSGGLIVDALNNEMSYELPETTGATIYVENLVYVEATNKVYATLQNAVNAAGTTPTVIKLINDNELRDTLEIKEGQNITIDLNGKEMIFESDEAIVTAIDNRGTLKIIDTSVNKDGKVISSSRLASAYTIINNTTGKLIIEDGAIEAVSQTGSTALESYAIYNKGAGEVTIGKEDSEIGTEAPKLIATAKSSIGLYSVATSGVINFYDGQILGTKVATYAGAGASAFNMPAGYTDKTETRVENGIEYEVAYLSNDGYVQLTMNGKTTSYKSIFDALEKIPNDGRIGSIKLLRSEELKETIKIYNGQNIEIDLNGYELIRKESLYGTMYAILNNGTLKIKDSSENKTGAIKAISEKDIDVYGIYNYTDGNLTIDGGKIYAYITSNTITKVAYGMYNSSSNQVNFNDGEIYNINYFSEETLIVTPTGKYLNQREDVVDGVTYKVNYVSSSEYMIELTQNGVTTGVNGIQSALNLISISNDTYSTIKIIKNIEFSKQIEIASGIKVKLDLNGKQISTMVVNEASINSNGDFMILDSSADETGKLTVAKSIENTSIKSILNITDGIIEFKSGKIISNTIGIKVSNGTLLMNGGYVQGENCGIEVIETGRLEFRSGIACGGNYGIDLSIANTTVILSGGEWKGFRSGIELIDGAHIINEETIQEGYINIPLNTHISYRREDKYVVNFIKEEQYTVELSIGNTTDKFLSIHEALYNVPDDGTLAKLKMLKNEALLGNIKIENGMQLEIDLNGNTLYSSGTNSDGNKIYNYGTLTIIDTSNEKLGTIQGTMGKEFIYNYSTGTLKVHSGNIVSENAATITNVGGNVEINGGYIYSNSTIIDNKTSGTVVVNDGILKAYKTIDVLKNSTQGTIILNGGLLTSDKIFERNPRGIYNNASNLYINGAKIDLYNDKDSIYNYGEGNVFITKGTIQSITNASKGKIEIGNNDGIINNEDILILGTLSINSIGRNSKFI